MDRALCRKATIGSSLERYFYRPDALPVVVGIYCLQCLPTAVDLSNTNFAVYTLFKLNVERTMVTRLRVSTGWPQKLSKVTVTSCSFTSNVQCVHLAA